jgi:hypothetical protein
MKIDSFVSKKSQNQESIVIKKLSKKSSIIKSEQVSEVVAGNEIDPALFEQKTDLRSAIRGTDFNSLQINEKNFYDHPGKKLYNDPNMDTASFASGVFTQDSRVNEMGKRNEFLNKQTQL